MITASVAAETTPYVYPYWNRCYNPVFRQLSSHEQVFPSPLTALHHPV